MSTFSFAERPRVHRRIQADLLKVLTGEVQTWADAISTEVTEDGWAASDDHPRPDHPGGLPAGWEIVDRLPVDNTHYQDPLPGALLVARQAGGWLIITHRLVGQHAQPLLPFRFAPTLSDLYVEVLHYADSDDYHGTSHRNAARMIPWLDRVLVGIYDPDDPVEAAEATLVALGGPVLRPPQKADQWCAYTHPELLHTGNHR